MAALSQMQLQAMERVEAQERELRRLSAFLAEHQEVLRSSPERPQQEPPQPVPPQELGQLRHEVEDILPGTVNTVRGASSRAGQVPDLGRPPILRRDIFEDILADAEDEVPHTPQRWVWFANVATSTPIPRPMEPQEDRTRPLRASEVPSQRLGLINNPVPHKDLYEEGFSHGLQVAATKFRKLRAKGGQIQRRIFLQCQPGVSVMAKRHPALCLGTLPVPAGRNPAGKRLYLRTSSQ